MNWLARVFTAAVVRKLAYVLVALVLAWAGIGRAEAFVKTAAPCEDSQTCTRAQAEAACEADRPIVQAEDPGNSWACAPVEASKLFRLYKNGNLSSFIAVYPWHVDPTQCAPGEWNNPLNDQECLSSDKCLARNALAGYQNVGETVRTNGSNCVAGCEFKATPSAGVPTVTVGLPEGGSLTRGVYEYSGNQCGAVPPLSEQEAQTKKEQDCLPAGDGQTFCQKANGEQCYSSSTGRQICWQRGETGDKTDGPVLQDRKPGDVTPPETKPLPNTETGVKEGNKITTTTTVVNNNGVVTTIITTTTNYRGPSGADAGDTNDGEAGDGSGSEGEGEDEGSSSGGTACNSPPVTVGDPLLAKQIEQNWVALCRGETGDENNRSDASTLDALADALEPQEIGIVQDAPSDGVSFNQGLITLGSGTCPPPPAVSINGVPFEWPARFCDIVSLLRLLFIAATLVHALRVVVS